MAIIAVEDADAGAVAGGHLPGVEPWDPRQRIDAGRVERGRLRVVQAVLLLLPFHASSARPQLQHHQWHERSRHCVASGRCGCSTACGCARQAAAAALTGSAGSPTARPGVVRVSTAGAHAAKCCTSGWLRRTVAHAAGCGVLHPFLRAAAAAVPWHGRKGRREVANDEDAMTAILKMPRPHRPMPCSVQRGVFPPG